MTYLSFLQGINVLVPIVTLPYLLAVLGKETYGLIIFAQALIYYLVLFQNFGLNTLAIKETSIHREDKTALSKIVNAIFYLKGGLFLGSFLLLWIIVQLIPYFKEHETLMYLTMWMCLLDFIFPKWYFQGIEKMKFITIINTVSKVVIVVLIFTVIKTEKDYLNLPIINGVGALISGLASIIIIFKNDKITFEFPGFECVIGLASRAVTFFISDISIAVFSTSNKVIIGVMLGMAEVAYYDFADKIVSFFKMLPLNIVRDAIFPRVAKTKNIKIIHDVSLIMGSYSIVIIVLLGIFAPTITVFLGGTEMLDSVNLLRLFSLSIFTTHVSNYYITVGLWSLGYEKIFRNLMIYSTVVFFMLYGFFWSIGYINIYVLAAIPIFVDVYLIIHTYLVYKEEKLI
ncbi:oligosaccharide flippase family protein [Flavobacteriaceae bacterium F08102]|nr:oligosaccharide flippase family protein [Flavobacteriaceae bacterium F08102]